MKLKYSDSKDLSGLDLSGAPEHIVQMELKNRHQEKMWRLIFQYATYILSILIMSYLLLTQNKFESYPIGFWIIISRPAEK